MPEHTHEPGHEGHSHGPIAAPAKGAKTPESLSTSYRVALDIWIRRFKEAQGVVRELEKENEDLTAKLQAALGLMSDEQLEALRVILKGP